jgi:hypothetical protein
VTKLLTPGAANAKIAKGEGEWTTYILHLAPANLSGYNVCPAASPGCKAACLNTAGRGRFDATQAARIRKTRLFFEDRLEFMRLLFKDIEAAVRKAKRTGQRLAVRLNGTSDIDWENVSCPSWAGIKRNVFEAFPDVLFYDYTKRPERVAKCAGIANYHLTFSRSEVNDVVVGRLAKASPVNVAVVFGGATLPAEYLGRPVIDGTLTDLRFLDPKGVVVGLLAKGKAKKDESGFVL